MASHEDDDNPIIDFEHDSKLWEKLEGKLQDVIQKLDGKWEKRFDEFESLLRTSLKRKLSSGDMSGNESKSGTTPKRNELDYDECDVLVFQEDEEEIDLEQCEKALIEGQGSSASTTEKDKGQLFHEIDLELSEKEVLGAQVCDGLATIVNGRFSRKLSENVQKEKFEAHNRPENCEKLIVLLVNKEEYW